MLVAKFTTSPPPASSLRACLWGLTWHNSTPLYNVMVKRNFLLGRDHLISICCDIFWKPISSVMGNGCRSRAIISVIYEQCKQMVFWIFGLFPKTLCKLSCCISLHEKPLLPGKGKGWLRIWLCTWKQGQKIAANLKKTKELYFIVPIASSSHTYRPSCVSQKETADTWSRSWRCLTLLWLLDYQFSPLKTCVIHREHY